MVEVILISILALLCFAFAIQVVIGIWKYIYWAAPIAVPLLVLTYLLMATNNLDLTIDTKGQDARYIESVENQSGRSEY
jgi:hypothetical protein